MFRRGLAHAIATLLGGLGSAEAIGFWTAPRCAATFGWAVQRLTLLPQPPYPARPEQLEYG